MGSFLPQWISSAAEITGEPGSTSRRVSGEVPDSEWPGGMLSFPAGPQPHSKGELHLHP